MRKRRRTHNRSIFRVPTLRTAAFDRATRFQDFLMIGISNTCSGLGVRGLWLHGPVLLPSSGHPRLHAAGAFVFARQQNQRDVHGSVACIADMVAARGDPFHWPECRCPRPCVEESYEMRVSRTRLSFEVAALSLSLSLSPNKRYSRLSQRACLDQNTTNEFEAKCITETVCSFERHPKRVARRD